jgi:ligand-binding sensor domain-containing protein/signal transduction histidine kinase
MRAVLFYTATVDVKAFIAILCGVFLLGSILPAPAEYDNPYFTRTWQAEDGLPENRVVGVVQSSDGFLWVATQNGLVRFDGVRFQKVDLPDSPGKIAGTMRVLMLDRKGRIWLAKEEGGTLFCFDGNRAQILTPDKGFPRNETPCSMELDSEGGLWITSSTGKVVRYREDGKVDVFTAKDGLPGGGVCWLASGRDGTLWFAKGSRVGVIRDGRFKVLENFGSPAVRVAAARSSGVWVCAGQRVLKYDEGKPSYEFGKIPAEVRERSAFDPSVMLEDREGAVWVGTTSAGLFRCDSNTVVHVEVSNPGILSLTEDREGNLWVGTRGGGLNRVTRRLISLIKSGSRPPFDGVQSVCQDADGALWAVGDNGVLARRKGTDWTIESFSNGAVHPYATCCVADTNGDVWIGARAGGLYHGTEGRFRDLGFQSRFRDKSLRSLLVMSNGDLCIGTDSSEFLYRLRGEELTSFNLPPGHRFIRAMTEDAAGNVWAGASDGLLVRVTSETLIDETAKSSWLSIRCLYGAANGDLWIGYGGAGIGRLRDGQITRFTTEQGLPNDYVAQIEIDDRGNLWCAGNQGIFQVREQDLDNLTNTLASRLWPVVYGRSEGMPGLQASFDYCPSSLRSSDGHIYFSLLSGLAEVRPEDARLNYRPPNVFIESVDADDQNVALYRPISMAASTHAAGPMELNRFGSSEELKLPPGLQRVQFVFTAPSFVEPENVQFRYQLEGLDDNWVEAGTRRTASYTHPPPGKYRFKVTACNNDGIWNKVGVTLPVVFEPYIWQTLWFRLGLIMLSFGILCGWVVLALRRRHYRIVERLEHQRALELERNRIARDLHDDLGLGLTEIGLLGDLAGASDGLPRASLERLREITGRARTLATSLDEIVWAINPANDTSQSLVDYIFPYTQNILGKAGIRCRLEVIEPLPARNLSAEYRHEFFHAYKEALNNIIRHSGATQVQVSIGAANDNLLIRISDNGSGLKDAADKGARHGLSGMRERLSRLGGRCEITSLADGGTTVVFTIPVKLET